MSETVTDRVARIETAATALWDAEPPEIIAIDILSDLRHYCDVYGIDLETVLRISYDHYLEEKSSNPF